MSAPATKPLLILAFNRPTHVKRLIDSLRPLRPQKILISVDGPRANNNLDSQRIAQVLAEIRKIDWTTDIELRVREKNLGLRFAVADAVTWVTDIYGEVIVLEDDVEVGPEFLSFMSHMLDKFRNDSRVGHISGYNPVPQEFLTNPNDQIRLSLIPESYAWATWSRAWKLYDPELDWATSQSLGQLNVRFGGLFPALVWKLNFLDAKKENINTWAYRWAATLWSKNMVCVVPNSNISTYWGMSDGTHTRNPNKFAQLEIAPLPPKQENWELDLAADEWLLRKYFRCSPIGVIIRIFESLMLTLIRVWAGLTKF